jgi:hypothetical protein
MIYIILVLPRSKSKGEDQDQILFFFGTAGNIPADVIHMSKANLIRHAAIYKRHFLNTTTTQNSFVPN